MAFAYLRDVGVRPPTLVDLLKILRTGARTNEGDALLEQRASDRFLKFSAIEMRREEIYGLDPGAPPRSPITATQKKRTPILPTE